jgi:hypothetical protein
MALFDSSGCMSFYLKPLESGFCMGFKSSEDMCSSMPEKVCVCVCVRVPLHMYFSKCVCVCVVSDVEREKRDEMCV